MLNEDLFQIQAFRFIRHTIWCFFACKFSSIKKKLDIYVNHYIFFCVFSFFTHSPFLCFRIAGTECHIKTTQTVVGRFTGWSDGLVLSKWVVLGQNKQLSTVKSFRNITWQTGQLQNYNNLNIDRPGTPINHDKKNHQFLMKYLQRNVHLFKFLRISINLLIVKMNLYLNT